MAGQALNGRRESGGWLNISHDTAISTKSRFSNLSARGSSLYSCYFLRMGIGLNHFGNLSDNAGKKRAKDKS
jgi:hypothetical protein